MKTDIRHHTPARLRGIALILALLAGPVSQAAEGDGYRMIAFEDKAKGHLVVKGRYAEAIERLAARRSRATNFERNNNLCVAFTKAAQLDAAKAACDEAVRLRSDTRIAAHTYATPEQRTSIRDRAIALSNRGVVRVLTGDEHGAMQDFAESVRIFDGLVEPQLNLDKLGVKTVASASTE